MPLKQSMQHMLRSYDLSIAQQRNNWNHVLNKYPSMARSLRIMIVIALMLFSYGHWVGPLGYTGVRTALYLLVMVLGAKLFVALETANTYSLIVALVNIYYFVCVASCIFHPEVILHTPATLAFLPALMVMNSVCLTPSRSIYLNMFACFPSCVALGLFMVGPNAEPGWTEYKHIALSTMAVGFLVVFSTHFSTLAARINTALLERERSEAKEAQMNQTMEREREKFRSDLAHMNRILIIETMSTTLAHEISQPINSTSVFLGAIRRWLDGPSHNVAEALSAAEKAAVQIGRAREIINSIRGFARKGGEQDHLPIDLVQCVDEVVRLLQKEFDFRQISIDFEKQGSAPPCTVLAVKHEIEQIVANLLLNSIEAFSPLATDRRIRIEFLTSNVSVDLRIIDNGQGLPKGMESEVFSKFVTTKETGTGLGLSISTALAEKFGGQLELEGEPQGGTIALLRLPLAPEKSGGVQVSSNSPTEHPSKHRNPAFGKSDVQTER